MTAKDREPMNEIYLLHHFLEHQAQQAPERILCMHQSELWSYGQIESRANQYAQALQAIGVQRGERVGLLLENSAAYLSAYYGVLKAGGVTVAIYTTTTAKTLNYVLNDCGVKILIAQRRSLELLQELRGSLPNLQGVIIPDAEAAEHLTLERVVTESELDQMPATAPQLRQTDQDLASIVYTSGSTGDPRGAMLSHLNLVTNTRSIVSYLQLTADDRIMVVLPFPYVYGKSLLNTHVAVGGSVAIDNRFMFPNLVLDTMEQCETTGFSGVPSTFAILLGKSSVRQREFPALRYLTQAGGAMAPALIREVMEVFAGKQLYIMYGATEAGARLSYLPPDRLPEKLGSIGQAIPNVELRVIKDDGSLAQPGEVGELVATGTNIMRGYWNQPEETQAVLTEHGFHTGDLGKADDEGFLYVVGRKRDMIKSGANRVSAKEIEETLLEHEALLECAVIGIPDDMLGEAIQAHVVLKPEVNGNAAQKLPEALIAFCREHLTEFKVPRTVIVEEKLPKNASGKIMKEVLRERFGSL